MGDFVHLISPAASNKLEQLAEKSKDLTQKRFGKTIRLFAPLYLSNECINNCSYCGFSKDNTIIRSTLSIPQVIQEGEELKRQGFSNVLLVAGEHPKFVSNGYVAGIFGVVLSHIIADIIACYLDPDLRKMIFGVVIGGIIPLFFIPILEKFVVKSKQSFLDEAKDDINRS